MANEKLTDLITSNPATSLDPTDLLYIANDVGGTPDSAAITVANALRTYTRTLAETAASVTPTDYSYEPGDVRRYGAVGDGVADDTTAFSSAASAYGVVDVPDGTYVIGNIPLTSSKTFSLSADATLKYSASAANHMLESSAGLKIVGGTVDGNRANRSYSQSQLPVECTGGDLELIGVKFTGTQHAAFRANGTLDVVRVEGCTFEDMEEHTGSGSTQTMAGIIRISDGGSCEIFLTNNTVTHGTPSVAGRNPGGFLWDGGSDTAGTGIKRVTAVGNHFTNIGQSAASNFIGCLHAYTTGGPFVASGNEFTHPYWIPMLVQNAKHVSLGNWVITDLEAGVNGVEVQAARSYTPDVVEVDLGRGVIEYESGATTGIGVVVLGDSGNFVKRVVGGPFIVNGGAQGVRIEHAESVDLISPQVEGSNGIGVQITDLNVGTDAPTAAQVSILGGRVANCGGIGISLTGTCTNTNLRIVGVGFEANTTNHIRGDSGNSVVVSGCDFVDNLSNPIRIQSATNAVVVGNTGLTTASTSYTSTTNVNEVGNTWQTTETYTPTNVTTDRAYDANSTTVAELGDVLGTLITDLQAQGLIQ